MPSTLAWLDTSPEEQRKTREILQLFEQRESRDEIGIGSLRDVLSNALFPGLSVLQTRARYYLFVPWCFQLAASRRRPGCDLAGRARDYELQLPERLLQADPLAEGIIGKRAGANLKIVPSTMYWNGLVQFGILRRAIAPHQLGTRTQTSSEADELVERIPSDWDLSIPPRPARFPEEVAGAFNLTRDEATWLRERMITGAPHTLLANLLMADQAIDPCAYPWFSATASTSAGDAEVALDQARCFSMAMQGASILYRLLVAERFEDVFPDASASVDSYADGYRAWADRACGEATLRGWDLDEFWLFVLERNARVSVVTRNSVTQWSELILDGSAARGLEADSRARALVAQRERRLKGNQSRLVNDKLLGQWGGTGGMAAPDPTDPWPVGGLSYRWPNVQRLVNDIYEGVHRA